MTRSPSSQIEGTQMNKSLKALERFHQLFVTDKKGCRVGERVSQVSQKRETFSESLRGLKAMDETDYRILGD